MQFAVPPAILFFSLSFHCFDECRALAVPAWVSIPLRLTDFIDGRPGVTTLAWVGTEVGRNTGEIGGRGVARAGPARHRRVQVASLRRYMAGAGVHAAYVAQLRAAQVSLAFLLLLLWSQRNRTVADQFASIGRHQSRTEFLARYVPQH